MENKGSTPSDPSSARGVSNDVLEELRELGRNLQAIVQSVWESEERKKLERELEAGLTEAYNSLTKAAHDFSDSPTGKNLKTDLEDLGERIRSGEVETRVRDEILTALRSANEGLKKAAESKSSPSETTTSSDHDS